MIQPHHDHDYEPDKPAIRRVRPRWWAVGLAGVTGLAVTTTLGIGGAPAIGAVERTVTAADDRPGKPDRAPTNNKDHKGKAKKDKRKGTPVPCSADALIAAITLANARGGAVLDLAKDCTYLLTADIDGAGLPAITTPITLNGSKHTTIKRAAAAPLFRILTVDIGGDLTLHHLKITGGQTDGNGGGVLVNPGGALTTNYSAITRNIVEGDGGGIANLGTTTIRDSTVSYNSSADEAGGILNTGLLNVGRSRFTSNSAADFSGAIGSFNGATAEVQDSTFTRNRARAGAGIGDFRAITTIVNSNFAHNSSSFGGGIFIEGQLTLRHVTVVNNTAVTQGGGINVQNIFGVSAAIIEESKISENTTAGVGGGIIGVRSPVALRNTKIIDNLAEAQGGGIYNTFDGTFVLFSTKVVKNAAVNDGGGIFNEPGGTVELNPATGTTVVKNRPNNCSGDVPGCTG
ncbi:right-handed parallel beta-helix repeat-containing protein [Salinispora arenicola]|uniref:right-handed parallel beta-helix repeat-containing protein n=1 Tax=Salinispora arenicola TaxID=168697 RepID=UPI00207A9B27|nr:right-handed parallel beta-helix repeat-containing protein [Salinispora arenicola]MCN0181257.1 right-handed parallel beta-helix repeat-containing protein [Salinispora arenicola]